MRVAIPPNVGCGTCPMCIEGYNQLCPTYEAFGVSYNGGFAEYMNIPANAIERGNVVLIPESLSFEEAAMTEPLSCTYNSYQALQDQTWRHCPDHRMPAPSGLAMSSINRLAGATKIIVADVSDLRLAEIKHFGADLVVNSTKEDLAAFLYKNNNGKGANIIITACSVPEVQGPGPRIGRERHGNGQLPWRHAKRQRTSHVKHQSYSLQRTHRPGNDGLEHDTTITSHSKSQLPDVSRSKTLQRAVLPLTMSTRLLNMLRKARDESCHCFR